MNKKITSKYIFDGYKFLPKGTVIEYSETGKILKIYKAENLNDIEYYDGIICPGFVNAHCHLELSHLKNKIKPNTGLVSFVENIIKIRSSYTEKIQEEIQNAELEMYNNGIVAIGDICNTTDSVLVKKDSKILWHNFIEVSGFIDSVAESRFEFSKNILNIFKEKLPNQFSNITPHAPYSVSKILFKLINENSINKTISIHNQECLAENKLYKNKKGDFLKLYENLNIDISNFVPSNLSSVQTYSNYLTNPSKIILVHNSFISEDDIVFLENKFLNKEVYFCVCINANIFIENIVPPIEIIKKSKFKIVIGTDSYASNYSLNILDELKQIQKCFGDKITILEMLQWATINGAEALNFEQTIGSIELGKKPGLVQITNIKENKLTEESVIKKII